MFYTKQHMILVFAFVAMIYAMCSRKLTAAGTKLSTNTDVHVFVRTSILKKRHKITTAFYIN
ncbi:hypothetical protein D1115_06380 [Vibrio alfacsensis]|uniref:Uncharacterized protein n=1 Tax=Vibrio alfacsensis TaxID=1074311 RepID=A0ABM6YT95_9VIBR|nr:hypothetical protein D1115_06380 [Vibrio alfacsensis]